MDSPWERKALSLPLLSKVHFGSFLAYSPRGESGTSQQSQLICHAIKRDGLIGDPQVRAIEYVVARLQQQGAVFHDLIAPDVVLVPCPRSAPFPPGQRPVLWVPMRICEALKAAGYGSAVRPWLERKEAVPKSAFAGPGARPSARQHFETMSIMPTLDRPARITVVDDVVTKGATLLAAASLVAQAFPGAEVRAFALVRTEGFVPDIASMVDPVVGRITLKRSDRVYREP